MSDTNKNNDLLQEIFTPTKKDAEPKTTSSDEFTSELQRVLDAVRRLTNLDNNTPA